MDGGSDVSLAIRRARRNNAKSHGLKYSVVLKHIAILRYIILIYIMMHFALLYYSVCYTSLYYIALYYDAFCSVILQCSTAYHVYYIVFCVIILLCLILSFTVSANVL